MATTKHKTEAQLIEQYRISLTNVENQKEIATTLSEYGYTSETIAIGKQLLEKTISALNFNRNEDNETIQARADFDSKIEEITEKYTTHRRKAKVAFRKDEVALKQLDLTGSVPRTYSRWLNTVKTFYNGVQSNTNHTTKLTLFKITEEDIATCITDISALESTRALYLREKGESQEATKSKDKSLSNLEEWMTDFYAVARIAMEDKPQLLETLGLLVRS